MLTHYNFHDGDATYLDPPGDNGEDLTAKPAGGEGQEACLGLLFFPPPCNAVTLAICLECRGHWGGAEAWTAHSAFGLSAFTQHCPQTKVSKSAALSEAVTELVQIKLK